VEIGEFTMTEKAKKYPKTEAQRRIDPATRFKNLKKTMELKKEKERRLYKLRKNQEVR